MHEGVLEFHEKSGLAINESCGRVAFHEMRCSSMSVFWRVPNVLVFRDKAKAFHEACLGVS